MTNLDYLYNKDATKGIFDKNRFIDKKLHFRIIEHGTVIPHKHMYVNGKWTWGFGGIVDSKNNFVKGSAVGEGGGAVYTPTEEIKHNPATVIYIGLFYPVWGHVITDNIRLIWFLTSEVFKNYFKNCPIVYNPWGGVLLNISETLCACLKFWESTWADCNRYITPHSLKTLFCPTAPMLAATLRKNIGRRLSA